MVFFRSVVLNLGLIYCLLWTCQPALSCPYEIEMDPRYFVSGPLGIYVAPSRHPDAAVKILYKQEFPETRNPLTFIHRQLTLPFELEISYKGRVMTGIQYHQNKLTKSFHFHGETRIADESQVILVLWHGIGASYSHAGSFLQAIKTMANAGKTQKKLKKVLNKHNVPFVKVSAEAMDLPFSGHGPGGRLYSTLDRTTRQLGVYLANLKRKASKAKIVVLARSASVGLIGEINHRYPWLIDGMMMMGPLHPHPNHGFKSSQAQFYRAVEEKHFEPNWLAFNWVNKMYASMNWHSAQKPFQDTPTRILVGALDPETPPEARLWFSEQDQQFNNVRYIEVPGASHNLFSPNVVRDSDGIVVSKFDPLTGYVPVYQFLNELIKN